MLSWSNPLPAPNIPVNISASARGHFVIIIRTNTWSAQNDALNVAKGLQSLNLTNRSCRQTMSYQPSIYCYSTGITYGPLEFRTGKVAMPRIRPLELVQISCNSSLSSSATLAAASPSRKSIHGLARDTNEVVMPCWSM
jgi:hypothetical protein